MPANLADEREEGPSGAYRFARHSSTKFEKLLLLAGPPMEVSYLDKDKRLLVTGLGEKPAQYEPIGNGVFQEIVGHRRITFSGDTAGQYRHMFIEDLPFMGTERVPASESPKLWYLLLGLSTLIFLSMLITAWYRRKDNSALPPEQKRAHDARHAHRRMVLFHVHRDHARARI